MDEASWKIRIDVGGTFTDGWALSPTGEEVRCKVLSAGILLLQVIAIEGDQVIVGKELPGVQALVGFRDDGRTLQVTTAEGNRLQLSRPVSVGDTLELSTGEDAPVIAARLLTGTAPNHDFPATEIRVATTRGTNALLEHKGTPVTIITNKGFETLLKVRDQRRPDLFELAPKRSEDITRTVIGLKGRLNRDGTMLEELDLSPLTDQPHHPVAVALINADVAPDHENTLATLLRDQGYEVSVSHELAPVIRLWPRMETTVANAYLTPVMQAFMEHLCSSLPQAKLSLMTSAGQLKHVDDFRPIDSLLSGPAGGVAGAAALARAAGFEQVLTFDMGGTSTDVARIAGQPSYRYEQEIGPVRVLAPAVKIETVAAGGGSICQWRNGGLEVGPESAGADPGPACYGRGGPLTMTDVNLLLGLMDEEKAGIPLFREAAQKRLDELISSISEGEPAEILAGLRQIAVEHMADALRQVSTRDGYDCREHALVAFGGAGPQHACALAQELGITTILIPADAGLLSAWGLEQADHREIRTRQILRLLDECTAEFSKILSELSGGEVRYLHELRLLGQDSTIEVEGGDLATVKRAFEERYFILYEREPDRPIEWVTARAESISNPNINLTTESFDHGEPTHQRQLVQDEFATLVIEPGWRMRSGSCGTVRLDLEDTSPQSVTHSSHSRVVEEELHRRRFESVVTEMGLLLQRTALSTNIKERLDFSCALLDAQGRLVVNAPHIPVHLGALGLCVREVSETHSWQPDDHIVVNHPAFGGSHLPDVTVITPVFFGNQLTAFVANRAHHAEIGGRTPGSMPPDARCLAEEGVVIPPTDYRKIDISFFAHSRNPADNVADLDAQVAANRHGVEAMTKLGPESLPFMDALYHRTASLVHSLPEGSWHATDQLDDGTPIKVWITHQEGKLKVDFRGSGPQHPGNLNATPAIVRSAVLYAIRLWVNDDLPLNEGLLDHVHILTEEGILDPQLVADPGACPAVVGGNVETSQRLVDVLLTALDLQAQGQGTMNNFLFGNNRFGFYETLGGGAGAGPGWHGRSSCHVHMSNTAITDPEVLEERFPVRVREFGQRHASGGTGQWSGGNGLIREIEFLEPMTVSLLTQRRTTSPQGAHGGKPGSPGRQFHLTNTKRSLLPGTTALEVAPGERIRIETPGGGGWGPA